jgi:hypothetical protein
VIADPRPRRRRWLLLSLVVALIGLLVLSGCPPKRQSNRPRKRAFKTHPAPVRRSPPVKRHPAHEHPHGNHPHPGNDHHHHPHPHPHMSGPGGHHHPY